MATRDEFELGGSSKLVPAALLLWALSGDLHIRLAMLELHVQAHLTPRTWFQDEETIELIEQHYNEPTHRLEGIRRTLVEFDPPNCSEPAPFQRRLYTIEELAEIFETVGLYLADVFDEDGRPWSPGDVERELYVEARC